MVLLANGLSTATWYDRSMRIFSRDSLSVSRLTALSETAVILLVAFSIVWKGGKSLEMTWILAGVAAFVIYASLFPKSRGLTLFKREEGNPIPATLWLTAILFVLWTVLSYLLSTTQNYGLDEVLRDTSFVLLFFWAARHSSGLENKTRFLRRFSSAATIAVLLSCAFGVLVYVLQPVNRFVGTFFDHRFHTDYWPNAWGELLVLLWPVVAYSLYSSETEGKSARKTFIHSVALGFIAGCFFLSYSRASILAFIAQLILGFGFIVWQTRKSFPFGKLIGRGILIAAVAALTFVSINQLRATRYPVQNLIEKATFTSTEGKSSISERQQFWDQSVVLAKKKPLFGWGPYSFRFVQPRLQQYVLATSDHPHNVFLKLAMERGIPAALFFLFIIVYLLWTSVRHYLSRTDIDPFPVSMVLILGITGALLHNLVDFNLQFVGIALPLWIMMGLLLAEFPKKEETLRSFPIFEVLMAVALLIVSFHEGSYLALSSMGRHAEASGDNPSAMYWYNRSKPEWFSRDLHLSRASILFDEGRFNTSWDALLDYKKQNTEDPRTLKREGDIHMALGQTDQGIAAYEKAFAWNRYNDLEITEKLLNAYLSTGRKQRIAERKEEFDTLLKAYADAIMQNMHFIAQSPSPDAFVRITQFMVDLYPDEAPRYEVMAAKVDHQAELERERIIARPPGFLW